MISKKRALVYVLFLAAAAAVVWQSTRMPVPEGPQASVINHGLLTDPESVDPQKARTTQAGMVLRDIGEGLMSYTADGRLTEGAAESWSVSDDALTYTFTIREAARWSNGDPLTAEHFVLGLRRLADPATGSLYGFLTTNIVNGEAILNGELPPSELGVEAVDDRTLVMTLERPTPYILSVLTSWATFPVHPASLQEHGDEFARPGNLLSNGAYKLDNWVPASMFELSRNEHYWNNEATAIDEVRYHIITQETVQLNRYRAGELDTTDSVPPDNFAKVREEFPDELRVAPYLGVYYYGFNLTRPPFKDNPGLRKALSMAIDRETLVERVTGRGEAPAYSWVPPGVDNYEPRQLSYAGQTHAERLVQARRLMAEAGYGPDNPLRFELRYNTSDTHQRIAESIQSMWSQIGAEVTLINEEFRVLIANITAAEITQAFFGSWIGDYNDAHTFLALLEGGSSSNMTRYASDEYDQQMDRAANQNSLKSRQLFMEEAERVMLDDHPVIPIYFYVSKHLVSPRVIGWEDNVLDYHYSQHLSLAPDEAAP